MEVRDTSISSPEHAGLAEGRAVRMPRARLITRKVSSEQTGGAYSLFEVLVAPGGGEGPHVQHREDECFYVLEGRFEFLQENVRIEAGPGSLVYVPKGNMHAFENAGETTGKLLVSQTPGGAYEGFVEEVGEPATGEGRLQATPGSPNNAEKLAAVGALYGVETVPPLPQRKPWRAR
jgi:mannose-6-phosphate isomerase-like protein (cupin superfamily)